MKEKYLKIKDDVLNKCKFIKDIHIIRAIVVSVLLLATFIVIYWHKGNNEFYVSLQDKLFIVSCMLITGLLYLFELKIKLPIKIIGNLIIFISFPFFFYKKLEMLSNDFSSFLDNAILLNELIILSFLLLLLAVSRNIYFSVTCGSFLLLLFYVINYFVLYFRGSPLVFSDIYSINTAMGVAGNYQHALRIEIVRLTFTFFVLSGVSLQFSHIKKKKIYIHGIIFAVSLALSIGIFSYVINEKTLEKNGIDFQAFLPNNSYMANGLLLHDCICYVESRMTEPEGYSVKAVQKIIEKYEKSDSLSEATVTPNIILIMNESFTDLDYLEEVELSEECIPFFKSIKDNCVRGTLISSILGGNTPNSEFECLTGSTMAFLPEGYVAFQQSIDRELPSIITTCAKLGYDTSAVHLYDPTYFDRKRIYPLLGIKDFYSLNNVDEESIEYVRIFASDKSSFLLLEDIYEKKTKPVFEYCVTIQNHGGYFFGMEDIIVTNIESNYGNEYSSLLKITDSDFEQLIEYFSKVSEPTIVCMFGDHQPYLFEEFYNDIWVGVEYTDVEKRYKQAKTPFVIWANYPITEKEFDEISINYLGVTIMETANLPMSGYQKRLLELRNEVPVICAIGSKDKNGKYTISWKDSDYYELLQEYEFLQFNYLSGNTKDDFYWVK